MEQNDVPNFEEMLKAPKFPPVPVILNPFKFCTSTLLTLMVSGSPTLPVSLQVPEEGNNVESVLSV